MKIVFFIAGLGAIAAALYEPAPWYLWGIIALFNAGTFWMVIANPEYGMDIDNTKLTIFYPKKTRIIALSEIYEARFINSTDSTDLDLVPACGRTIRVPPWAWGSERRTRNALEARGVKVVSA